jgi:glutathione synthase/RimK-type ligase-like ATP-grasp enzyme
MVSLRIRLNNQGSASGRLLAEALGAKRLKEQGSTWRNSPGRAVILWGLAEVTPNLQLGGRIVNPPDAVRLCANKLTFFRTMGNNQGIVPWTDSFDEVKRRFVEGGVKVVVGRRTLTGHSGEGIVIMERDKPETWVEGLPLYTDYIPKKEEYRVHIAFGQVIDVQKKVRKLDVPDEDIDWKIRNLQNGFVYARENLAVPEVVLSAVTNNLVPGLDFGAYDVVYNERNNAAFLLEVNTAPGLKGTTLTKYVEAFLSELRRT